MNNERFIDLLGELTDADWQAVLQGQAILLVDDRMLKIGSSQSANAVFIVEAENMTVASTKAMANDEAQQLLADYYQKNMLTRAGFNSQLEKLIEKIGAHAFAAPLGQLPERTVFVEGGDVVAATADSPRHRYGAFCELEHSVSKMAVQNLVNQWLASGQAYEEYLAKNV